MHVRLGEDFYYKNLIKLLFKIKIYFLHFRAMWVISFLCLLGWFISYLVDRSLLLASSPVTTKVEVHEQDNLQFPAVTICNYNMLRKSVVLSKPEYHSLAMVLVNWTTMATYDLGVLNPEANFVNMSEFNLLAAHTLESMVLWCTFMLQSGCIRHFTPIMTSIGLCYTFNSQELIDNGVMYNTSRTGLKYGLRLLLNVQQEEYFAAQAFSAGIKVHNKISKFTSITLYMHDY